LLPKVENVKISKNLIAHRYFLSFLKILKLF
jgi:hypothetical protein